MTVQKINLHPILLEDPTKIYSSNKFKARIYKMACLINIVAICIFSVYLAYFFGSSVTSLGLFQFLSAIIIPIFGFTYSKFYFRQQNCLITASFYQKVINEIQVLNQQPVENIKKFLTEFKCRPMEVKLSLNAIAHFKVRIESQKKFYREAQEINQTNTDDINLKHKLQKTAHNIYEKEVLKAKLKAAELFYVISNPYGNKRLGDIGKAFTLSFSKRMASILSGQDYYFVFNDQIKQERKKSGLSFREVDDNSISDISKLIFNF
ncbi:MAG: hypothetical protein WCT85_07010 [Parachlamydiales bacterium]|jgi:Mor family transcriptional regulator